ncbi:MAG: hypothetical protein F6K10_26245, partial [Moorea sp. SIO2B7]|nr:hypothetical protein [Moorena sp. SIO2B7]
EEDAGSKANCTTYFEEYLLPQADSPLVLCLDDVDLIFPYKEIYEDFFALLRFWYERAKSRKLWKKLRLAVAYSTEVYIPLNINQSPFNVGVPVDLPEFTPSQVQELAKIHGQDWNINQVEQLMAMVGGYPYLLELAFAHLNSYPDLTLPQLLAMAPTESGIYSDHLRKHLLTLEQDPELALAFKKVVKATEAVQLQPTQAYKLNRMGLINLSGNQAQLRCQLYRQYFREYLKSQAQGSLQTETSGNILVAIAFTNVVDSTTQMISNPEEKLELLNRDFQIMESICQQYEGKLIKSTEDGLLIYFASAVKAVACAREIQNILTQATATTTNNKVLSHRIGIHLGEVFFSGKDVMGTGVNIAARLQSKAKPGGICISEAVYQVVKSQLTLQVTCSESQQLKGIPEPVKVCHIMP